MKLKKCLNEHEFKYNKFLIFHLHPVCWYAYDLFTRVSYLNSVMYA